MSDLTTSFTKKYPPESAGSLMTQKVPIIGNKENVKDAINLITKNINEFDSINYLYVVDKYKRLSGVISIKELFKKTKDRKLSEIMQTKLAVAKFHTDQEIVAKIAIKNNIKEVPVIDRKQHFLGIVTSDKILNIVNREFYEDELLSVGVSYTSPKHILHTSIQNQVKNRLPWLIIGLFGGIIAAVIVERFEFILLELIILASFIPAITYISDAVGAQSQTLFIRSLALDNKLPIKKYASREITIGIILSIILGSSMGIISYLISGQIIIGIILCLSFICAVIFSIIIGLSLPLITSRLSIDPAIASGPMATVTRDITSITIYLSIASLLLLHFS